jgi:phosphate/sulfate permease
MVSGEIDTEDALPFGVFFLALAAQLGVGSGDLYGVSLSDELLSAAGMTFTVGAVVVIGLLGFVLITNDNSVADQARNNRRSQIIYGATALIIGATLFAPGIIESIFNSAGLADSARAAGLVAGSLAYTATSWTA